MPKCCGCNSSGACKFCSCVRFQRRCSNCSPSQYNRCCNLALPGATPLPKTRLKPLKPLRPLKPPKPSSTVSFAKSSKRSSLSSPSSSLSSTSSPSSPSSPPFLPASSTTGALSGCAGEIAGEKADKTAAAVIVADATAAAGDGGSAGENVGETAETPGVIGAAGITTSTVQKEVCRTAGAEHTFEPMRTYAAEALDEVQATRENTTESVRLEQPAPVTRTQTIPDLPHFKNVTRPNFSWGSLDRKSFATLFGLPILRL